MAITPRHQVDDVLMFFARSVGTDLVSDPETRDFLVRIDEQTRSLEAWTFKAQFRHDPRVYLAVIAERASGLVPGRAANSLKDAAHSLRKLANDVYHGAECDAQTVALAATLANKVLAKLGYDHDAEAVFDVSAPPTIKYVAPLRQVLVKQAGKPDPLISYEAAAKQIGLAWDAFGERQLYRQLNVLAAKQLLIGQPQLCALVVLADKKIPGDGFYWVLDVPRDAPNEIKKRAHTAAVEDVVKYRWE